MNHNHSTLKIFTTGLTLILLVIHSSHAQSQEFNPIDKSATKQTKALYANLIKLSSTNVLFGHQDALAYGVHWKEWHKMRSDVKDVSGKHPAVFGWEMSKLGKTKYNIDSVNFDQMKEWMKLVYKKGGVNTIGWHMDQFGNDKDSWNVGDRVVETVLPGGKFHAAFNAKLDLFVEFVQALKVGFLSKKQVPIIFRPWHEHSGSWFWWGEKWCTKEEYIQLFRYTVEYLRDKKGLHNILYCYSPDVVETKEAYLDRYPGDEYVDVLGIDVYKDFRPGNNPDDLSSRLKLVTQLAKEKNKIAVLSETGFESIPQADWWTQTLLPQIKKDKQTQSIAYLMVWRNDRLDHHYAPFPNHQSAADFKAFTKDKLIMMNGDYPNLYKY